MSATTSIIKNFIRCLKHVDYATCINIGEISNIFKMALEYHTEIISVDVTIDESVLMQVGAQEIDEENKRIALTKIVDAIIKQGLYEKTETKEGRDINVNYKISLLIDRGY